MSEQTQIDLLKSRRFLPLFLTQFANALNDNLFKNAVMVLLTLTAVHATALVNLCAALFVLPFFLFSAQAGQIADRFDKARLARLVKMAEIGIMAAAALGLGIGSSWLLLACVFCMGIHSTFFGPIKYAILPQHLSNDELIGGNGLIDMGTFLGILLGTIVGGGVVGLAGGPLIIGIAILSIAAIGFTLSRFIPAAPAGLSSLAVDWNPVRATRDCLRIARTTRSVWLSILGISWFYVLGATYLTQLPLYVKDTLGGQSGTITLLLAIFSVGVGFGSVLCERLSGRSIELGLVPFGAAGLLFFGFHFAILSPDPWSGPLRAVTEVLADRQVWPVLIDLFGIGVFGGFYVVPLFALIQSRTKPEERARVIAANNIMNAGSMVAAAAICTVLLSVFHWSVPDLYLLFAVLNIPVAIYIFSLLPEFLLRFVVWILTSLCYRIERRDIDKVPASGAAVLVCNHVSLVDALIVSGSCRRPIRFVMESGIYRLPLLNLVFRAAGAVPISSRRAEPKVYEAAFDRIADYLRDGELVLIFPEGGLTRDGEMTEFKAGILRILRDTPVPVVPMALSGLWGSFFSNSGSGAMRKMPRRAWARLRVTAGDLIAPETVTIDGLAQSVAALRGDWR